MSSSSALDILDVEGNALKMWGPKSSGGSVAARAPVTSVPADFNLPTIDLSQWHTAAYRAQLAGQMSVDARNLGFFYVKAPQDATRFSWDSVNDVFRMCTEVFENTSEADRINLAGPHNLQLLHGYQKMATQLGSLSQRAPSLKECLAIGRPLACNNCDTIGGSRKPPMEASACSHEPYPVHLRAFPDVVNQLRSSMEEVANVLLDLFSLSLGVEERFFRELHQNPRSPLRLHHYPPMPHDPSSDINERAIAAAEHTDYGTITLLLMARNDPGGLQVFLRDSATWMNIPYREDCLVVNVGDLLMRWTNDRYVSNVHRVLMPDTAIHQAVHRYSIAYFVTPAKDTLIKPITIDSTEEVKYPIVTAGQYGDAKRTANFKDQQQRQQQVN